MLAAVTTQVPKEIKIKEILMPNLSIDELLIKVHYCGVCGSDLHAYHHAKGYEFVEHPRVLGHEISGVIVKVGHDMFTDKIGQQVVIESMNYCGECDNCLQERYSICSNNRVIGLHFDGGMAEYVVCKAKYVKGVSQVHPKIAVLSEPMSVAVHAIHRLNREITDRDVVLVQGPGIIGFFVALLCVERGAKVYITGLRRDYHNRLKKFKKFQMIPNVVEDGLIGEEADIVFECSGSNQSVDATFKKLKKGGSVVVVALFEQKTSLFLTDIVRSEWSIIPSYGSDPADYEETVQVLNKHAENLEEIIHYYPFAQVKNAFEDGIQQNVLKPVIQITEDGK